MIRAGTRGDFLRGPSEARCESDKRGPSTRVALHRAQSNISFFLSVLNIFVFGGGICALNAPAFFDTGPKNDSTAKNPQARRAFIHFSNLGAETGARLNHASVMRRSCSDVPHFVRKTMRPFVVS